MTIIHKIEIISQNTGPGRAALFRSPNLLVGSYHSRTSLILYSVSLPAPLSDKVLCGIYLKNKANQFFSKLLIKIKLLQNTQGRRNDYHSENRDQQPKYWTRPCRAALFRSPNFREGNVTQYCENRINCSL